MNIILYLTSILATIIPVANIAYRYGCRTTANRWSKIVNELTDDNIRMRKVLERR